MQTQSESCKVSLVIDCYEANVRRQIHVNIQSLILDEEYHMTLNFEKG